MKKSLLFGCLVALLALAAGPAFALNYQYYPLGERAAGLGGAFIALSDDASGAYYNPAGLAFAKNNSFSLTGTVYGFTRAQIKNAIGFGAAGGDLNVDTFYSIPTLFGTVYRFGTLDFKDQGPKDNAFAFTILTPDYFNFRNETKYGGESQQFSSQSLTQTYWFGPAYARRLNEHFSIGATLFGLFGLEEFSGNFSGTFTKGDFSFLQDQLKLISEYSEDTKTFNALAQVGAQFVWDEFHLGLVVRSPSLPVWGSGSTAQKSLVAYLSDSELTKDKTTFTPIRHDPVMVGLGLAWTKPLHYTLTADVKYHGADRYQDADKKSEASTVKMKSVINCNVGAEYVIKETAPLQVGFYTNFSPYSDVTLDTYGLTFSTGLIHMQTSFNMGVNYAWGQGSGAIPNVVEKNNTVATVNHRVDLSVMSVNFMLSTSYRF